MQPDLQQGLQIAREWMRPHPLALDDTGIAETGLVPRLVLVDQGYAAPAPQQMNAGSDADDSGTKNEYVVHADPPI